MFSTKTVYLIFVCLISCYGRSYKNFALLLGIPLTDKELVFFKNLSQKYDVIFWKEPSSVYKPLQFAIGPREFSRFYEDAKENRISLGMVMDDVQSAFDNQFVAKYTRRKMLTFDWSSYYDLKSIYSWLGDLEKRYPNEVAIQSIGRTFERRDILSVKLFIGQGTPGSRPKVIVEGGIHAREWISPAFVTYMIKDLLNARDSNNTELQEIATNYEFHFIPVANPDGYEYSHTEDRLWRKNRREGYGVDLNRNFGLAFGEAGEARLNKYSDGYCGEAPFSEAESAAIAKFTKSNSDNLKYYISFHSFGQYFIIPYGYTKEHIGNFETVKIMASYAVQRLSKRYGTEYSVGSAYETVGRLVSGSSAGWAKKACKIPYVASIELRDTGKYGFALPSDQILPTCLETMDCMYSFLKSNQGDKIQREPEAYFTRSEISRLSHFKSRLCYYMCLLVTIKVK